MEVKLIKVVDVNVPRDQSYVEVIDPQGIGLSPRSKHSVYAEPMTLQSHRVPVQRVAIRDKGVERIVNVAIVAEARLLAVEPVQDEHSRSLNFTHTMYHSRIRELERQVNSLSFDRDAWVSTPKWTKLWQVLRGKDLK